eukprot:g4955.t1
MLPTTTPKWRVNSAVGCYKDQTSTPLFNFGSSGKPHACDSMGIAQLSNRMIMAPDGLTFQAGGEGMVGVAYVRTPFGKTSDGDDRNFWTVLVDTDNVAGPLGYFLPEFWGERWDSPNPSPGSAAIGDLGKPGHGLSMGGGAFEWNTLYNFKDSDTGAYKVPSMALPLGPDGQTTLFKDARGFAADDVVTPLEEALASGKLDPSKIMNAGTPMSCRNGTANATYRLEGSDAAHLVTVGSLHTTVDSIDGTASESDNADGPYHPTNLVTNYNVGHPKLSHADGTPVVFANPSGLVLGNGSTVLLFRDYLQNLKFPATNTIGLAVSKAGWRGPYTKVRPQIFPNAAE